MRNAGRPRTVQSKLMDGFYIEVSNKGSTIKGVRIRSENKNDMENAASAYRKFKAVVVLGEYKDEAWLSKVK
jgi:hypothetical protein